MVPPSRRGCPEILVMETFPTGVYHTLSMEIRQHGNVSIIRKMPADVSNGAACPGITKERFCPPGLFTIQQKARIIIMETFPWQTITPRFIHTAKGAAMRTVGKYFALCIITMLACTAAYSEVITLACTPGSLTTLDDNGKTYRSELVQSVNLPVLTWRRSRAHRTPWDAIVCRCAPVPSIWCRVS